MLWDVIIDFFIKYIFGGESSDGTLYRGYVFYQTNTRTITFALGNINIPLGNYLSLIATIISMVVILVLCCMLIKKIYNMCAHIIG